MKIMNEFSCKFILNRSINKILYKINVACVHKDISNQTFPVINQSTSKKELPNTPTNFAVFTEKRNHEKVYEGVSILGKTFPSALCHRRKSVTCVKKNAENFTFYTRSQYLHEICKTSKKIIIPARKFCRPLNGFPVELSLVNHRRGKLAGELFRVFPTPRGK